MAAGAAEVALIGAGGVVVGAAVGALSGWASAAVASRSSRRGDCASRRRTAYAAFIGAAEELIRLLGASDTMKERPAPESLFGVNLGQAVGSVDRMYVAVLLDGSQEAKTAAKEVRQKSWDLYLWLRGPVEPGVNSLDRLASLAGEYAAATDAFTKLAADELA